MTRGTRALLVLLAAACVGPGDALELPGLARIGDVVTLDIASPQAPQSPEPAQLTPCPSGWSEVPGPITSCEPWPLDAGSGCAADEAHFPGEPACRRIGTACSATDDWAEG